MADYTKKLGNPTHLHGLFIVDHGFLHTKPIDRRSGPLRKTISIPITPRIVLSQPLRLLYFRVSRDFGSDIERICEQVAKGAG
jgi:hypothetical protein